MPLQLTGRHMTITDRQREYIDKKVERLRRLLTKIDEMSVTLTKEKIHFEVEGTVRAGRIFVQASETAEQPMEGIDILVDKLEAQIRKAKNKMQDKHPADSREKNREIEVAAGDDVEGQAELA